MDHKSSDSSTTGDIDIFDIAAHPKYVDYCREFMVQVGREVSSDILFVPFSESTEWRIWMTMGAALDSLYYRGYLRHRLHAQVARDEPTGTVRISIDKVPQRLSQADGEWIRKVRTELKGGHYGL